MGRNAGKIGVTVVAALCMIWIANLVASQDLPGVWGTGETAVAFQYSEETVTQYSDGASAQYGDETVPTLKPEATIPQGDTPRARENTASGDVDGDGAVSPEASTPRAAKAAARAAARRAFASYAAGGGLPEDAAYRKAESEARQAAEAEGLDQDAAEFIAKDAADQALLGIILERMPKGSIALAVPKQMLLGSSGVVELLLSPSSSVDDLKQMIEEGGKRYGARIRMGSDMEANLQGPGFQIDPITPERQGVALGEPNVWKWQIRPTQGGSQQLQLALNAYLAIEEDGEPINRQIETFKRSIEVQVTVNQRAASFFSSNWQFLWTALLVPLAVYLWNRYRKPEAETDSDPRRPNSSGSG